ncbi:unnamed protein product, partial [Mesorhabditis spiculigera]
MAQSVAPGDITTQPGTKIVFNAPYDDKHTYHIKVINSGGRRIGWAFKTTNMKRLGVDPPCGVLDPKEQVLVAVSCDSFQFGAEDTNNDRVTIEWTNTPDGAAKQFRREWFQGDGMVLPSGQPVLGCAAPQCFGAEAGGTRVLHDAQFNPGPEGEDGFMREGDLTRVRSRYRDAEAQQAECPTGYGSSSCTGSLSWVGGFLAKSNGDLSLQCCRYEGLKFAAEVGRPVVRPAEVYSGGEVIRDGRQTGFDLITNIKRIDVDDGGIAYELTVTRMNCIPDPPESENDVNIAPSDISRILDKVSEASAAGAPTEEFSAMDEGPQSPASYQTPSASYAQPPPADAAPPPQPQQYVERDQYVQVGEQVVPVQSPGYYYPVSSGIPACFTGDTLVETSSGFKRMDELRVGEQVLTAEQNTTTFTRVDSWLHRLPSTTAYFVQLRTQDEKTLKLTPQHFIYRVDCSGLTFATEMIFAEMLKTGDCVYAIGADRAVHPTRIVHLEVVEEKGVYAPMTRSGDIFVNGIYASCHNVVKANTLSHTFLHLADNVHQRIRRIFIGDDETAATETSGHLPPSTEFFLGMIDYIVPHKY